MLYVMHHANLMEFRDRHKYIKFFISMSEEDKKIFFKGSDIFSKDLDDNGKKRAFRSNIRSFVRLLQKDSGIKCNFLTKEEIPEKATGVKGNSPESDISAQHKKDLEAGYESLRNQEWFRNKLEKL